MTEKQALQQLEIYLTELNHQKSKFKELSPLTFPLTPDDIPDSPPNLPYPPNKEFIEHYQFINVMISRVRGLGVNTTDAVSNRQKEVIELLTAYDDQRNYVSETWKRERDQRLHQHSNPIDTIDCSMSLRCGHMIVFSVFFIGPHSDHIKNISGMPHAILASIITVLILTLISNLPRNGSNFLLYGMRTVATMACTYYVKQCFNIDNPPNPLPILTAGDHWPIDIRMAMAGFYLDPDLVIYASCPKCFSCYDKVDGKYPEHCKFLSTPDCPPCGTKLTIRKQTLKNGQPAKVDFVPIQPYTYQPITSYLSRLLSRPGLLEQMKKTAVPWNTGKPRWWDFFGARAFRQFLGPDGERPFLICPDGETRLIFSLFVDWFNPYGNKIAGKKASIGAIYMICLNLPPHLRFRVENVYLVGIIPGEPHLDHINHLLHPLILDLLPLWHTGIKFLNIISDATHLLVHCAIVPLVADLPASRKASGFAAHSAKFFCSFCRLPKSDITNIDVGSWLRRSRAEHYAAALHFRDAPNAQKRDDAFNTDYTRWSELLRLPYWDPTKFTVIDPMHNLFLNLAHYHIWSFWKLSSTYVEGRRNQQPHSPTEQGQEIDKAHKWIKAGNITALSKMRRTYIEYISHANQTEISAKSLKNIDLATAVVNWVMTLNHMTSCTKLIMCFSGSLSQPAVS